MALVIKASVSRKLTEDFNSKGWALELQSEFDPRMLDDTEGLAKSTDFLFQIANDLLDQQVTSSASNRTGNGEAYNRSKQNPDGGHVNRNGSYGHNGANGTSGNGNGARSKSNGSAGHKERPITAAQINAIQKMATRLDTNGDAVAREDFNAPLKELSIKQASQLIDNLKKAIEAPSGQGVQS